MKKLFVILSFALSFLIAFSSAACNKDDGSSNPTPSEEPITYTLQISNTTKDMFVGETFTLSVKKYDDLGAEQTVENISYTSDNSSIASVENGVVTANAVGQTYVSVTADGLEAACFVEVKEGKRGEVFEIRFAADALYKDVPAQAFVYVTRDGVFEGVVQGVTFTADDSSILSVSESGVVTALAETDGTVLRASGTYNGKAVDVQTSVKVIPPYVYEASSMRVTVAATQTYSGASNDKYISSKINVMERNAITGEKTVVDGERLEVVEFTSSLFDCEIVDDDVTFTANGVVGSGSMTVCVDGKYNCFVVVTVSHAISTIADMDKLAFAHFNKPADLSSTYVLTNDIDYEGKPVYPIANFVDKGAKRYVGYQYKYALSVDGNGYYTAVDRANVGIEGYGLTDEQFISLAGKWSSPANVAFTGTFDGNGYSIKNATLMYGANMGGNATDGYLTVDIGVFGQVSGATIKNIGFELSIQNPDTYAASLSKIYDKSVHASEIQECTLRKASSGAYRYQAASVVNRAYDSTFENIYLTMSYVGFSRNSLDGALVSAGQNLTVCNNAIEVVRGTTSSVTYTITSSLASPIGKIENNLMIGANGVIPTIKEGQCSQSGNWFTTNNWKALYGMNASSGASNSVSRANVIASFATSVWDMSKCNTTDGGAPQLINGCSVPQ